jgi:hypothetical protein
LSHNYTGGPDAVEGVRTTLGFGTHITLGIPALLHDVIKGKVEGSLLVEERLSICEKGYSALDVVEAAYLVEHNLLDLVHGIGLHLDDKVVDSIETVYTGDLLDSIQGFNDLGLHPEFSV